MPSGASGGRTNSAWRRRRSPRRQHPKSQRQHPKPCRSGLRHVRRRSGEVVGQAGPIPIVPFRKTGRCRKVAVAAPEPLRSSHRSTLCGALDMTVSWIWRVQPLTERGSSSGYPQPAPNPEAHAFGVPGKRRRGYRSIGTPAMVREIAAIPRRACRNPATLEFQSVPIQLHADNIVGTGPRENHLPVRDRDRGRLHL